MELSKLNTLTEIKFKTMGSQEIGYPNLFYNRRIIIFSLPLPINPFSVHQLRGFAENYNTFKNLGIDDIYSISSNAIVIPFTVEQSVNITPLSDVKQNFVKFLKPDSPNFDELARLWQYSVIVNNGTVEKLFSNPLKSNMPLHVYCNRLYQYRSIDAETILSYLQK